MKEQTPIERLESLGCDPREIILDEDLFNEMVNKLVLEALEREFKKVAFMLPDGIPLKGDINYITGEQHYETELKPNYES